MDDRLLREFIKEAVVAASPEYMKKERVREHVQAHLLDLIRSGEIKTDEDLQGFFSALDMTTKALSSIPMMVWLRMTGNEG